MIDKVVAVIGIGLLVGNQAIGSLFGYNSGLISIFAIIIGIFLIIYVLVQYDKQRTLECEELKVYRNNKIILLEKIASQENLSHCVDILEKYIIEADTYNNSIKNVLYRISENIILLNDTQKAISIEKNALVKGEVISSIIDVKNELLYKLSSLYNIVVKCGWRDTDVKELLKLKHDEASILTSENDLLKGFFEYVKLSNSTKNEKADNIYNKLVDLSKMPNDIQEVVADTFDEILEDIKEYKDINLDSMEECFDNLTDSVNSINKKNTDLIRKIEDELSETRKLFNIASNDLQIQIKELSNQINIFEQTMNSIMCQMMKMSEEDAKIIKEMLNGD